MIYYGLMTLSLNKKKYAKPAKILRKIMNRMSNIRSALLIKTDSNISLMTKNTQIIDTNNAMLNKIGAILTFNSIKIPDIT